MYKKSVCIHLLLFNSTSQVEVWKSTLMSARVEFNKFAMIMTKPTGEHYYVNIIDIQRTIAQSKMEISVLNELYNRYHLNKCIEYFVNICV